MINAAVSIGLFCARPFEIEGSHAMYSTWTPIYSFVSLFAEGLLPPPIGLRIGDDVLNHFTEQFLQLRDLSGKPGDGITASERGPF